MRLPELLGHREIKSLEVKCDNVEKGCGWNGTVGTLEDHVTKCDFAIVSCPNGCYSGTSKFRRKDLPSHTSLYCPEREYQCQDCGRSDKYRVITGPHEEECEKKMVSCPNKLCGLFLERGHVQEHVSLSCDYFEVCCKYASVGCEEKRVRKEMKDHENATEHHLAVALNKITELNVIVSSITSLPCVCKTGRQVTFKLSEYSEKKKSCCEYSFEPFFTSPKGYKMSLFVYANGEGSVINSHLSVYLKILHGPHDDQLDWPLKGTFVIEVLNQLEDNNHHSLTLMYSDNEAHSHPGGTGWGYSSFIEQSELSHVEVINTQYLKDDLLYFRVSSKVSSHRTWLDYTHQ